MVAGTLEVSEGQATLRGGASIVARDRTAELALDRGGLVEVCATSSLHVTSGVGTGVSTGDKVPLLFALDRGAIELRTIVGVRDAVITPDLRMSAKSAGRLDLRVRVTINGDTCVESRGAGAPAMEVVEQFGDGVYQVGAGQHVLFEHGSVREVVDRESSPCGCPPAPVMSLAESGVTVAPGEAARGGGQAAAKVEEHPFPAAESQGLAPIAGAAAVPQAPLGQVHAQVAATMAYAADAGADGVGVKAGTAIGSSAAGGANGGAAAAGSGAGARAGVGSGVGAGGSSAPTLAPVTTPAVAVPQAAAAVVEVQAPAAPAPPGARDLAHRIGHFFKRVFGGR